MFQVGQQVVCLYPFPGAAAATYPAGTTFPHQHGVYTVRAIEEFECADCGEIVPCIWVEEIVNPVNLVTACGDVVEPMWLAEVFRPAVRTDISTLRDLLAPSPAGERVLEEA